MGKSTNSILESESLYTQFILFKPSKFLTSNIFKPEDSQFKIERFGKLVSSILTSKGFLFKDKNDNCVRFSICKLEMLLKSQIKFSKNLKVLIPSKLFIFKLLMIKDFINSASLTSISPSLFKSASDSGVPLPLVSTHLVFTNAFLKLGSGKFIIWL
ncbi:MAG: hypothetical protein IPN86_17455 [Saprospiraceae bacterium]|nr:hypothetical protein [Saprospiraceae bacterium]